MSRDYWAALAFCADPRQLSTLVDQFTDGRHAWEAGEARLVKAGLTPRATQTIIKARTAHSVEQTMDTLTAAAVSFVVRGESAYPLLLTEIADAPAVLFYRGTLPRDDEVLLGVVGTRRYSRDGGAATVSLVRELAGTGLVVTSGLARGIDALAHETTIERGGCTIAVLGSSVADADCYPPEHRRLADQIVDTGGAVLSEYPPGVGPARHHFPQRNRIIAGLSRGTLVIEAPERSGALITARLALDYNREVFAVPGRLGEPAAVGSNALLKLGARVVTEAADVLDTLSLAPAPHMPPTTPNLNEDEQLLAAALNATPRHIDTLNEQLTLTVPALAAALTSLELKGLARDVGGKHYVRLS